MRNTGFINLLTWKRNTVLKNIEFLNAYIIKTAIYAAVK